MLEVASKRVCIGAQGLRFFIQEMRKRLICRKRHERVAGMAKGCLKRRALLLTGNTKKRAKAQKLVFVLEGAN